MAALVLLAHHPDMTLKELWPDETDPGEFLVHILRLLIGYPAFAEPHGVLNAMIANAARPQVKEHLHWLQMPPEEIAAFLVPRHFADAVGLQNPATQLAGLHIFAPETPVAEMEKQAGMLIGRVSTDARLWPAIQRHAEAFLSPKLVRKVLDLAAPAGKTPVERITGILQKPLVPVVIHEALREAFLAFFADPSVAKTGMLGGLAKQPMLRASQDDDSDRSRQEQGQYTLLGQFAVRLDQAKDHYWADVPALGDNMVRVSAKILEQYADVLLTSGAWGTMEIEYDATYEIKGRKYPFDEAEFSISVLKDYMQTGKFSQGDQEFSRNAKTSHRPTGRHETRGVPRCGFPFLGDRVPVGGTVTRYADEGWMFPLRFLHRSPVRVEKERGHLHDSVL